MWKILVLMAACAAVVAEDDIASAKADIQSATLKVNAEASALKNATGKVYVLKSGERIPVKSAIESNGNITLLLPESRSKTMPVTDVESVEETPVDKSSYKKAVAVLDAAKARYDTMLKRASDKEVKLRPDIALLNKHAGQGFGHFEPNKLGTGSEYVVDWTAPSTVEIAKLSESEIVIAAEKIRQCQARIAAEEEARILQSNFDRSQKPRAAPRTGE